MPKVLGRKDGDFNGMDKLENNRGGRFVRRQFSSTFYVLADALTDEPDAILATTGIPPLFYPTAGAWVVGRKLRESQTVTHPVTGVTTVLWEVQVDYDSAVDIDEEEEQEPEAREPVVRWTTEEEEIALELDAITGEAIQTEAGEPIIMTTKVKLPVLEVRRYELYPFDPDVILSYDNKVCSTEFYGAPPFHAYMTGIEADQETINGTKYAVATYRVAFKFDGSERPWKAKPLHYGTKYRPAPGEPAIAYQDENGNLLTVNLQTGGTPLPEGDTPQYLSFNRFNLADFNLLSLGPF